MFVDPKITLTRRVTDPAGTIRKARVLLDQHLRQDAAYNRRVSKTLYFIGPDVTCQITHEFDQTYIALDQKTTEAQSRGKTPTPYQFLNILFGDYTIGWTYLTAWASQDGNSWTQLPIPPAVATCLQYGVGALIQISRTRLFLVGQFDPTNASNGVGWALVNPQTLSASVVQKLPLLNGNVVIESVNGAFVGGAVVCLTLRTSAGNFLAWFDYVENQYRYVLPYTTLGLPNTGNFLSSVQLVSLTKAVDKLFAQIAIGVAASGGTEIWTADVNAYTAQSVGGLSTSFTGAYLPMLAAGANGQLAVGVPTASAAESAAQTGTDFYFLTPSQGTTYSGLSYALSAVGLGYTPVGWTGTFSESPNDLFFFSPTAALGVVPRSRASAAFINYVVAVNGIYDVMGGGFYNSPAQKSALPLGLPPYSDPNNPAYALNTLGLTSQAFYLGPQIAPWLNLY